MPYQVLVVTSKAAGRPMSDGVALTTHIIERETHDEAEAVIESLAQQNDVINNFGVKGVRLYTQRVPLRRN